MTKTMQVFVTVTVTGQYDLSENPTISADYSAVITPALPDPSVVIVDADGNIDLAALPVVSGYGNSVEIVFKLAGQVIDTGDSDKRCQPDFPHDLDDCISVWEQGQTQSPGLPSGWGGSRVSDNKINITDPDDDDGLKFNYQLTVKLNGNKCAIDPSILNRGAN
ncbi:hypothetical protein [Aurantiacibacter poecillastricola]|uniref:hypothetical protein n=1 Tax=Aurantiacibacter poecillastricola TaxID=3064385 RepID=UPI00273DFA0C|nr:hypothetical protein [Aurantiacibacter sp. 219JJ12-13]MDP5262410.1 hypothetical protein [Aurantiacibacter sp. 219JJ12-13]